MRLIKKLLLTTIIGHLSFLSLAQGVYVFFNEEGKLEKITKLPSLTAAKAYPSILSKEGLGFDFSQIKTPQSAYWKSIQDLSTKLSLGPFPSSPANDILNDVLRQRSLPAFLLTTPKEVLEYDPTDILVPVKVSTRNNVYSVATTETDWDLNKKTRTPLTIVDRDRIEYKLIRTELDNDILQQHLTATYKPYYKGWPKSYDALLLELRQKFRNQGWIINSVLVRDTLHSRPGPVTHPFNIDALTALDSLDKSITLVNQFYEKVLGDNKDWIESWLWYTGGEIRLNPFPFPSPDVLIKKARQEISELENEIESVASKEVSKDEGTKKDRIAFLLTRLQLLKQALNDSTNSTADFQAWLNKVSVKSKTVYSGIWHGSHQEEIRWLHHFDAAREFRFLTDEKKLPNMVAETDQMVIYTHNLKTDDKITITSVPTPFEPKSALETTTDEIATQLTKAVGGSSSIQNLAQLVAGLSNPTINNIETSTDDIFKNVRVVASLNPLHDLFRGISTPKKISLKDLQEFVSREFGTYSFTYEELKTKPEVMNSLRLNTTKALSDSSDNNIEIANNVKAIIDRLPTVSKSGALIIMYQLFNIIDTKAYVDLLIDYKQSEANLLWLSSQTPPLESIELKADEKSIYHTQAEFPEKQIAIESSNKIAYTGALANNVTAFRRTYSKYFRTRFMPSFGLVYIPGDRSALIFDETTGQFKSQDKDFDHVEALVGVKWYPGQTNPARTMKTRSLIRKSLDHGHGANVDRGNSFWNTLYVTGGFGVRRQLLKNYYLGLGGDITPGLSLQGGLNFIFTKEYILENAKIKSEKEVPKPFWYFGLGLDLGLVANLIRVLIP